MLTQDATSEWLGAETLRIPIRRKRLQVHPFIFIIAGSMALFFIAASGALARLENPLAQPIFWITILAFYAFCVGSLIVSVPRRGVALIAAITLTLVVSSVKLMLYPYYFVKSDEFMHLRTLADIEQTGHLFTTNTLLPVSPEFPGLELATHAIIQGTGLSPFAAGMILILIIRLLFALVIFRLSETLLGSHRQAALGVMIVLCNPQSLFFNTQFSYETLAVPLALLIIYWILRHNNFPSLPGYLLIAGIAMTHHLTSYILTAILLSWTIVYFLRYRNRQQQSSPLIPAMALLTTAMGWTCVFGRAVISYLFSSLHTDSEQLILLLTGHSASRQLFADYSGQSMPTWERAITLLAVLFTTVILPVGWFEIWRRHRTKSLIIILGLLALLYPVTQVLRLTPGGGQVTDRLATFLFIGIAFVMLLSMRLIRQFITNTWVYRGGCTILLLIMFWGGILLSGNPNWAILPGPYLVNADQRSVEPKGIDAAIWASRYLIPHQTIYADRTGRLLMSVYGDQNPQTILYDRIDLSFIYMHPYLTLKDRSLLRKAHIAYLDADYRLTQQFPRLGFYFEPGESNSFRYTSPLSASALNKFDGAKGFDRVYDGGDIVLYHVTGA